MPWISAFMVALASSTDNFALGVAWGLGSKPLPFALNLFISVCNAIGAYVSAASTLILETEYSHALLLISGFIFFYLGYSEYHALTPATATASISTSNYLIALPMTLNNLMGGVAGGLMGISPHQTATAAFLVSFGTMWLGHAVVMRTASRAIGAAANLKLAAAIYAILGITAILQVIFR